MPDFGVHGVGEIDRCRLGRQRYDLTFWSEHVDFGSTQIFLQGAKEFIGIRGLTRPVGELLNPLEIVSLAQLLVLATFTIGLIGRAQRKASLTVLLVLPMRGDTEFRTAMHVPRTNLNLDRLAARPHHRGMQALVHVELWHGDVILETARNGVPTRMHRTQRGIAILNRVDDDAHTHQIVDIRKIMTTYDHLLINREIVLRTSRYVRRNVLFVKIFVDLRENLLQIHVSLACATGHQHHDLVVDLRIEHFEAELFQFGFDRVHAETIGKWRVHVKRFMRFLLRARSFDVTPGTRVVYTVGEFDDQHTHVAAHRDHHLANGFGLRGIAVFHLGKLGDAIDQTGHGIAELGAALIERIVGVLNRVVQQAGGHNQRSHAEIGKNLRHGQRVDDVRLARFAPLRRMLLDRTLISALKNAYVLIGMMVFAHLQDRLKRIKRIRADLAAQHSGRMNLTLNVTHRPPPRSQCSLYYPRLTVHPRHPTACCTAKYPRNH